MDRGRSSSSGSASEQSLIDALNTPAISNLNIHGISSPSLTSTQVSSDTEVYQTDEDMKITKQHKSGSTMESITEAFGNLNTFPSESNNVTKENSSTDDSNENDENKRQDASATTQTFVSKEQERKELILFFLAQVCALQDSTPKTFIIHVLSLYESGILDDDSIHRLVNLGLIPTTQVITSSVAKMNATEKTRQNNINTGDVGEQLTFESRHIQSQEMIEGAIVPLQTKSHTSNDSQLQILTKSTATQITSTFGMNENEAQRRSRKVFEIRTHLQLHEEQQQSIKNWSNPSFFQSNPNSTTPSSSWSVEHHPLSFSRYHRDFIQRRMLASGSFGQVFHAVNKLDNCDYAVKCVAFNAKGYDTKQVEMVIREVQCLAKMGHENVVRYYTSWLEPIWSPTDDKSDDDSDFSDEDSDSSDSRSNWFQSNRNQLLLLEAAHDARDDDFSGGWSFERSNGNEAGEDWDELASHHTHSNQKTNNGEQSQWTIDNQESARFASRHSKKYNANQKKKKHDDKTYKYSISMYIQMQLCKPTTLADWIRQKNQIVGTKSFADTQKRFLDAAVIFKQISEGLAHVHSKGIIHRDLKPANIFQSVDDDSFKIGDFGLSKQLTRANGGIPFNNADHDYQNAIIPLNRNRDVFDDLLTEGVGTSSYAAPEQMSTQNYGKEADIFSLGLILLELVCEFSSAHERAEAFKLCRNGIVPDFLNHGKLKEVGDLILACTNTNPRKRPSANSILRSNLFHDSKVADVQSAVIKNLEKQLKEKSDENARLLKIIHEQAQQIRSLSGDNDHPKPRVETVASNDYSDEDDY